MEQTRTLWRIDRTDVPHCACKSLTWGKRHQPVPASARS